MYRVYKRCGCRGVEYQDGDTIPEGDIPADAAESLVRLGCIRQVPDEVPEANSSPTNPADETAAAPEPKPQGKKSSR